MLSVSRRKMLLMSGAACLSFCFSPVEGWAIPRTKKDLENILDELTKTSVSYGAIPSINSPEYIRVADAALSMDDREQVFIVFFPDGPRIFPQKIMVWHEIVNEYLNGQGYCITYSPISGSVAAYKTNVLGMTLILDSEGRLFNNSSVLIDRNTGSLWLQFLGMSFSGPLEGKGLEYVPLWWTRWKLARKMYPEAKVLTAPRGERKAYGRDPYGSYITHGNYYDDERIMFPVLHLDRRLHPKSRIVGFEYDKLLLAVDERFVRQKQVVNFYMGPNPLVALLDPRLDTIRVFDRTVWNSPALFKKENGRLVDVDTGSVWSYDGKALSGNLKDAQLEEMVGMYAFWFAWAAFHPETILVPGPTVVPDSALIKGTSAF